MNRQLELIDQFKKLDEQYFKKFMEFYPIYTNAEKEGVFGPSELYEMAIEAQSILSMLGRSALMRMKYIGFDVMYPFDNPVDWFNWKENVKVRRIPQSIYFSIAVRMASELDRMKKFAENDSWQSYEELSESEFLVSKQRYISHFEEEKETPRSESNSEISHGNPHINIENLNYNAGTEKKAVDNLDRLQKKVSIWSGIVDVASKILGLKI